MSFCAAPSISKRIYITTLPRLVLKEMKRRKNTGGNSARESCMFLRICCTNRCACCSFDSHWYYDWSASARFLCLLFATKKSALYRHACRRIKLDLICCVCNTIPRKSNNSMLQKALFECFYFHCVKQTSSFPHWLEYKLEIIITLERGLCMSQLAFSVRTFFVQNSHLKITHYIV